MIWASGCQLASVVSNAGGLDIIGSGSMYPYVLKEHIVKCKIATENPFSVNVPLIYHNIDENIQIIIGYKIPFVFTSAGNPKILTSKLKAVDIKVIHGVSSKFAQKARAAVILLLRKVFNAGGHN